MPSRLALALAGLLLGLLLAEGALRSTGLDWWLIRRGLPRVHEEVLSLYRVSDDPILAQEPIPSSSFTVQRPQGPMQVHFDAFGFRGPERERERPPGTLRILVFGASNVFGFDMDDHQTFPLQLERELGVRLGAPVEVFNGGVGGFDPWLTCHWASLRSPALEPDLIILALSNFDLSRHFHPETPDLGHYFVGVPGAWEDAFGPHLLALPGSADGRLAISLLDHLAVARTTAVAAHHALRMMAPPPIATPDQVSLDCIQRLAQRHPTLLFGSPATPYQTQQAWAEATGLELYHLHAAGRPPAFAALHPDAGVYTWYAQELADWLVQSGQLP